MICKSLLRRTTNTGSSSWAPSPGLQAGLAGHLQPEAQAETYGRKSFPGMALAITRLQQPDNAARSANLTLPSMYWRLLLSKTCRAGQGSHPRKIWCFGGGPPVYSILVSPLLDHHLYLMQCLMLMPAGHMCNMVRNWILVCNDWDYTTTEIWQPEGNTAQDYHLHRLPLRWLQIDWLKTEIRQIYKKQTQHSYDLYSTHYLSL